MAWKDWETRWTETINYLDDVTKTGLVGTHVQSLVANESKRQEISKQLSLGSRDDGEDDPAFAANTDKRHALRALLMCQRVYYAEDTWARTSEQFGNTETIDLVPFGVLQENWKAASLAFWSNKSETEIHNGIKMFEVLPGARPIDVQQAAYKGRPNGVALPGNLKISRTDTETVGFGVICYVGVQGWLVKSGMVSMRWFQQNSGPNGKKGCNVLFGEGSMKWEGPITPADYDNVRRICKCVSAGQIVHLWSPQNNNWNGHWVVANGDGTVCGVNNAEVKPEKAERGFAVQKDYTKTTTLFEQLVEYSRPWADSKGTERRTIACMAVIDPMQIPNRI